MTSPATKLKRQQQDKPRARLPAWARYLLSTIFGAILGLFAAQWFAEILPGPHLEVTVQGLKPESGGAQGCILYTFTVMNDKSVEYSYLKIQLPNRISAYRVGYMQEGYAQKQPGPAIQLIEAAKTSGGECEIIQAAVNNTIDIQSSADANMIEVHISKLSPHRSIMGALIGPVESASVSSPEKYFEGSYEYTILGQRVQRPVRFQDMGVIDAK
jgi:hypothetical protein